MSQKASPEEPFTKQFSTELRACKSREIKPNDLFVLGCIKEGQFLSGDPVTPSYLVSETGYSRKNVHEHLARLVSVGLVKRQGYGEYAASYLIAGPPKCSQKGDSSPETEEPNCSQKGDSSIEGNDPNCHQNDYSSVTKTTTVVSPKRLQLSLATLDSEPTKGTPKIKIKREKRVAPDVAPCESSPSAPPCGSVASLPPASGEQATNPADREEGKPEHRALRTTRRAKPDVSSKKGTAPGGETAGAAGRPAKAQKPKTDSSTVYDRFVNERQERLALPEWLPSDNQAKMMRTNIKRFLTTYPLEKLMECLSRFFEDSYAANAAYPWELFAKDPSRYLDASKAGTLCSGDLGEVVEYMHRHWNDIWGSQKEPLTVRQNVERELQGYIKTHGAGFVAAAFDKACNDMFKIREPLSFFLAEFKKYAEMVSNLPQKARESVTGFEDWQLFNYNELNAEIYVPFNKEDPDDLNWRRLEAFESRIDVRRLCEIRSACIEKPTPSAYGFATWLYLYISRPSLELKIFRRLKERFPDVLYDEPRQTLVQRAGCLKCEHLTTGTSCKYGIDLGPSQRSYRDQIPEDEPDRFKRAFELWEQDRKNGKYSEPREIVLLEACPKQQGEADEAQI